MASGCSCRFSVRADIDNKVRRDGFPAAGCIGLPRPRSRMLLMAAILACSGTVPSSERMSLVSSRRHSSENLRAISAILKTSLGRPLDCRSAPFFQDPPLRLPYPHHQSHPGKTIGTLRRDCLDHILSWAIATSLLCIRPITTRRRTHTSHGQGCAATTSCSTTRTVIATPIPLHHHYARI